MDTKPFEIQCTYTEDGEDLSDILIKSFRVFLQKELYTSVTACSGKP